MTYAYVINGQVKSAEVALPDRSYRLVDGVEIRPLNEASINDQRACGYYIVQTTPLPTMTATQRADRSVQFIDGEAREVWTVRTETPEEQRDRIRFQNGISYRDIQRAQTFLTNSAAFRATSNASINNNQLLNHVKQLSLAVEELLRINLGGVLLD